MLRLNLFPIHAQLQAFFADVTLSLLATAGVMYLHNMQVPPAQLC